MQRWKQAAGRAALVAGLAAALPAWAAEPAPGQGLPMALEPACELPDTVRDAFERRQAQGQLTRAEVRAQVEVWRASGMSQLSRARPLPDVYSERYRQHYATYLRMRSGPEYAAALCQALRED
ncbi:MULTISPECIES: hypothetical protein [Achromobacter]|uniref:hypothetical protein n=1 Tax=Achromobacter TaxID=222 RepID=UPI0006C6E028|nr:MULTISPECIES: hypothetical protein [Achromobacter]MCG2606890.1 hypothetical protein [Achromobacter sp.]CUJ24298.1 Uncharacterised protein [Achromobacter sp. 2789STDY5608621]CUK11572.1 Uncharacterised protein [Achromobacter sp. 2789STDY5608615]